jgi:signal peptidase I
MLPCAAISIGSRRNPAHNRSARAILDTFVSRVRRIVFGENPRRTSVRILVLAAVSLVTYRWVLMPVRADGDSMLPTYQSGKLNIVNRLAYLSTPPRRGDIVAIRLAGPGVVYIKRIIGLPGERVSIVDGDVLINSAPLSEPYVRHRRELNMDEVLLQPDEYFVMGDNRVSSDFGRVDGERIIGRLLF